MEKQNDKIEFKTYDNQKLIYVFRINDERHKGLLKVGEATNHGEPIRSSIECNTEQLKAEAHKRIGQETITAGIEYDLLYTTVALTNNNEIFNDKTVHKVLKASNIKQVKLSNEAGTANEWFECDLQTVINAINAVKENRKVLKNKEKSVEKSPIILRTEQQRAIKETIKTFKKGRKNKLWDAKMRFGKTITALSLIKEYGFRRTLIYTHRPVVNVGWYEDFNKVFYEDDKEMNFGSRKPEHLQINDLLEQERKFGTPFIYFASLQDLRGKDRDDDSQWKSRNQEVFKTKWDLIIIDEAHEGAQTKLGQEVFEAIDKPETKVLSLSGTPFNFESEYEEEDKFVWDYLMEQNAKENWDLSEGPNPYTCPKMNIFTYKIGDDIRIGRDIADNSFNFKEFFRVYTGNAEEDGKKVSKDLIGKFVHEDRVKKFLDLLSNENSETNYPFSTTTYREMFNHTLWRVPGVKEARALSKLLQNHKYFGMYTVINVAGVGDEDVEAEEALKMVRDGIDAHNYTITLSCGKLTTGVTVKEWSAILYLTGSKDVSISAYLQTIFRVQNPCIKDGKIKKNCYVFDFAPDRVLMIAPQIADITSHNKYSLNDPAKREILRQILKFLPVISMDGSSTVEYNVDSMMSEIKKASAEIVASNGFDRIELYDENQLMQLSKVDIKKFNDLQQIIGKSCGSKVSPIVINNQGLNTKTETIKTVKKPEKKLTKAEIEAKKKLKEVEKLKQTAVSILRGMSVRIPLLVYGMKLQSNEEITIDNFTNLVDTESWAEFMPNGVTKEKFTEFKNFYDRDIFRDACNKVRERAKAADKLSVFERMNEITTLFESFKNPDKETILTPWKVVNMQLQFSCGGYQLYNENNVLNHTYKIDELSYKDNGEITKRVINVNAKNCDINAKTGFYSLYMAYNIYKQRIKEEKREITPEILKELWEKTIKENIYALCKTKMAKMIVIRTLCGFDEELGTELSKHIKYVSNYIDRVQKEDTREGLVEIIQNPEIWGKECEI